MRAITRVGARPAGPACAWPSSSGKPRIGQVRGRGSAPGAGSCWAGGCARPRTAAEHGQTRCALEALPARHREILQLVAVEALKYEVAAAGPEVPSGTVPSRSSRARSPLGFFLERHVAGEEQGGAGLAKGTGG
jgi:hypothetical protein